MNNTTILQSSFRTMDLNEAALFLGAHKETVRRLVARRELPGVKIGRAWRFIEADLVNYMRNKYSSPDVSQGVNNRSKKLWHSTKEMGSGGLTFATREKEYVKALGLK